MSDFTFLDGMLDRFCQKLGEYLENEGITKTVEEFKKEIKYREPNFEHIESCNQADMLVFYIGEIVTAVLKHVSDKKGHSFEDEREKFLTFYLK